MEKRVALIWPPLAASSVPLLYLMYAPAPLALGSAVAAFLLVGALAWLWPGLRLGLLRACGATGLALLAMRMTVPVSWYVHLFVTGRGALYWLVSGPGFGLLGLLPGIALLQLCGAWIYEIPLAEQWGGRPGLRRAVWGYGLALGALLALLTIAAVLPSGQAHLAWGWSWADFGVNLVSNLYEEILARGLLLQVVRRAFGDGIAMAWTSIFFGIFMHGPNLKGVIIAATTWTMAWAVLRTRSLWTGWIAHQTVDALVDSLLH